MQGRRWWFQGRRGSCKRGKVIVREDGVVAKDERMAAREESLVIIGEKGIAKEEGVVGSGRTWYPWRRKWLQLRMGWL